MITQIQQNLTKPYCSQFGFGYLQIVFCLSSEVSDHASDSEAMASTMTASILSEAES